ncbi:unnamed protein product [Adineta steineri]|uniref:G-protein coupled receptors family 1 profile domain-containing protein n=1 Tax=Adineta steineri TaxID=433720 RepID=A0A820AFM6_9BILA|nr:unnamed protein product [Adineta steineri]
MINDQTKANGFILSSISLGFNTIACLISCIIFLIIIYHLYYNHVKREDKITVVLCGHIYLAIVIYSSMLISMNVRSILGYLAIIIFGMLYMNFLNQALYRLIRIVYSQNRWFLSLKLYIILPIIEIIIITPILLCVLIPLNGVTYLPNDYFCYATFTNIPGVLCAAVVVYMCPLCCISFIYMHITKFIRQQGNIQTLIIKQRQARDLLIIRRILIIVVILLILGIPAVTLVFMFIITGEENPLFARISFFPVNVSQAGLSIALLFSIPQLKKYCSKLTNNKNSDACQSSRARHNTIENNCWYSIIFM